MIEIVEVIRMLEQGATKPWLCRCSDNNLYVVKGSNASPKELTKELICANLATVFGLPTPEFNVVRVALEIIESELYDGLNQELCFGSKFIDNLEEIKFSQIKTIEKEQMLDLYAFDYWIKNSDRNLTHCGGNPNTFVDLVHNSLVVLDHNLAFDESFLVIDHKDLHIASSIWNCEQKRIDDISKYSDKFATTMERWNEYVEQIPLEWFEDEAVLTSFIEDIKVILLSFKRSHFWEGLE